jgi:broad specificity phosphatase PhoE
MNTYLVRHGQTTGDVENRYGGDYDDHLTALGQRQSREVAEKLAKFKPEAIYASPKIRAKETAQIIKEAVGPSTQLVIIDDFRERNRYGVLSGLTKEEALSQFPDEVKKLGDENATLTDGEDYESFGKRVRAALAKIEAGEYSDIAVITHGGPIRYIFREILKQGDIEIGDCAYAKLSNDNGAYALLERDGIKLKN